MSLFSRHTVLAASLLLAAVPAFADSVQDARLQGAVQTAVSLNKLLNPALNYDILQQLCSAELPTGKEKARLQHTFGNETIELVLNYAPRQIDVPVRVFHQRLDRYSPMAIGNW